MPPPIHLHGQSSRRAVEVEHIPPNGMLPPKPRQPIPETAEPQPSCTSGGVISPWSRFEADLTRSGVLILRAYRGDAPSVTAQVAPRHLPRFAGEEKRPKSQPRVRRSRRPSRTSNGTPRVPTPTLQPPRAGRAKVEPQARPRYAGRLDAPEHACWATAGAALVSHPRAAIPPLSSRVRRAQ